EESRRFPSQKQHYRLTEPIVKESIFLFNFERCLATAPSLDAQDVALLVGLGLAQDVLTSM
ncbi:hypothetical protein, partial [Bacillus sp. V59.32b]|uniref:hypothetical protein n=1 Tax=Bacillus sp. V59.32b TaxID=1758642 RepID=UPI000ED08B07